MHKQVAQFIETIKLVHPGFFRYVSVLDCGSLDINGSNRRFFADSVYTGIDIVDGRNVEVVTRVHDFKPNKLFDVVISTEMLEHDEYCMKSLAKMFSLLSPGGLLIITAAAWARKEHGTIDHSPKDSPATNDYYKHIDIYTFASSLPMHGFSTWQLTSNDVDIQFHAIKKPCN